MKNFLKKAVEEQKAARASSLATSRSRPPPSPSDEEYSRNTTVQDPELSRGEGTGKEYVPDVGPFASVLPSACPSHQLPMEVPLLLACGTNDAEVPIDYVEDFFWKAKESAFACPPPLMFPPFQSTCGTNSGIVSGAAPLTALEQLNKESCRQRGRPFLSAGGGGVRESTSLVSMKLLKLPDADHYAPVLADHPAFLKLFDEMYVIAPGLADVPELDIAVYRPDEIRLAMEYHSNSKTSSRNSSEVPSHLGSERASSKNNLEDICEDDGTASSVGDASPHNRNSHGPGGRESSISRHSSTRQSKSSTASGSNCSGAVTVIDSRISESVMHMLDNDSDELQSVGLVKPYSYSSSDDGGDVIYHQRAPITTPNGTHVRKQRAGTDMTDDSRDSFDGRDRNKSPQRLLQHKEKQQELVDESQEHKHVTTDARQAATDSSSGAEHRSSCTSSPMPSEGSTTSDKSSQDLQFFSFPAPVSKTKRRSFILPKFM